jgi:DNA-binding CsgD family transcriptional regulator
MATSRPHYTNRAVAEQLFVSPHTVNAHLRHVFASSPEVPG